MTNYQLFQRSRGVNEEIEVDINVFKDVDSQKMPDSHMASNDMLSFVRPGLELLGFKVEAGKGKYRKIPVPFGENNNVDKSFCADTQSLDGKIAIKVEALGAVFNNQFLKYIFQACKIFEVEVFAFLNEYHFKISGKDHVSYDFQMVKTFLETMNISNRLYLLLKGILLIGY